MTIALWKPASLPEAYARLFDLAGSLIVCSESPADPSVQLDALADFARIAQVTPSNYAPRIAPVGSSDLPGWSLPGRRLVHFRPATSDDARLLALDRRGGMFQVLFSSQDLIDVLPSIVDGFALSDAGASMLKAAAARTHDGGFVVLFGVGSTESLEELCLVTQDSRMVADLLACVEADGESTFRSEADYQTNKHRHPGICVIDSLQGTEASQGALRAPPMIL